MQCLSINASHSCQVHSKGCSGLRNQCWLHYHTADSVQCSWCSFIRQHIWIKISTVLAIMGRCMRGKWFSSGKGSMWIRVSRRQIHDFETFSTGSITSWGGLSSVQRCHRLWSRLWSLLCSLQSASVGQRLTFYFASPACQRIVSSAICARKASGHVVLIKHSWVSFYYILHHGVPTILNTPHHLFWHIGVWFLDHI